MSLRLGLRAGAAAVLSASALVLSGTQLAPMTHAQTPAQVSTNVTVVATGLNNPRGLRVGPDGNIYVAEAGNGGTRSTMGLTQAPSGKCQPVPGAPGPGPVTGGNTGRVSMINPSTGARTTVLDNLPSATSPDHTLNVGPADVEFLGGNLYVLLDAGCGLGNTDIPSSVIRVNPDGSWVVVNDLSKFLQANPVKTPDPTDYLADGDWYSMTVANNQLVVANPNAGDIDVASPWTTSVTRLVDMSAQPWPGPTTIVYHNGNFYVGMLGEFPTKAGRENIYQVTPSGQVSVYATGLTAVTGIGFDSQNRLYALELSGVSKGPAPFTGQVVRVNASGAPTTIAKGLMFPTAMTFGPDGNIYVSNFGDMGPGAGQVVRVSVPK